jgi:hypothetical protein
MTQRRVSGVGMCGRAGSWQRLSEMAGWVSPLLGIRFGRGSGVDSGVYAPSGERFVGYVEVRRALEAAVARELEARRRAEQLAQKLRELGIDPDQE